MRGDRGVTKIFNKSNLKITSESLQRKDYLRVVDKGCDVFVSSDLHAKVLLLDHTELAVGQDSVGESGVDVTLVLGHGPLQDLSLHLGNRPACLQRHAPDTVAH